MNNLRLLMWMLFIISLLCIALIAFGDENAQNMGGGILFGVGFISFIILIWNSVY